jgi:hypothetical protein
MYDRAFGIEFEMGARGPLIRDIYDRYGTNKYRRFQQVLLDNGLDDFNIGHDGTEFEVRTPPLSGPNGLKKIKKFLSVVLSPEVGGYVTNADGLHIHHDAPEFVNDSELTLRLVENWIANQYNALKMVHPRRVNSMHCPQWSSIELDRIRTRIANNRRPYTDYGRKNLNINALYRHGTIEFRCHEGTLEYDEILSWVRFGQAFIDSALRDESIAPSTDINDLLNNVRVSRFANRFLPMKANQMAQIAW